MINISHQEIDFLTALKNMHFLFWRFSGLKRPDKDLFALSNRERSNLYKKYSKELDGEKIKKIIKSLLDHRISCIENCIFYSEILYNKIEEHDGELHHYLPPSIIHTFRLTTCGAVYDGYRGSLSEFRYYSRRSKSFEKTIEQSTHNIGNISPGYNGWANSRLNISENCAEYIEAQNYIESCQNHIQANNAIYQLVCSFFNLTGKTNIANNYIVFEYLGEKFSIDFQKSDILTEDEFTLKW